MTCYWARTCRSEYDKKNKGRRRKRLHVQLKKNANYKRWSFGVCDVLLLSATTAPSLAASPLSLDVGAGFGAKLTLAHML